jgi:hypothetical protein
MAARRITSVIPRLTAPQVIKGETLPVFSQICRLERGGNSPSSEAPRQFHELLEEGEVDGFEAICTDARSKRLVFLGEQHQQPKVLSAQMQVLYRLLKDRPETEKVHVVFEQWSLSDQPFLDRLNRTSDVEEIGKVIAEVESDQQDARTSEGFFLSHYAMLLRLVREMHGHVWAGFPPREWARLVAKGDGDVFGAVQQLDANRYTETKDLCDDCIPPMPKASYDSAANVSWAHRSYLKGMFSPDRRPHIPEQALVDKSPGPAAEHSGFTVAQALKDSFFAHTINTLLRRESSSVVIGVCGLGHCEWSFGAPERVAGVEPYIIITKPVDSPVWPITDKTHEQRLSTEWHRRQADAILLYEWID